MSVLSIIKGDITRRAFDIIVNATDNDLSGGGGVDEAIHKAAGTELVEDCKRIGYCHTAEAVVTRSGELPCRHVIHVAGPVWRDGEHKESQLLRRAYGNCFRLARELDSEEIAFPAISVGAYCYPAEQASEIALKQGLLYRKYFKSIVYVCFNDKVFDAYKAKYEELLS